VPEVSIVIVAYKSAEVLPRALRSISGQRDVSFEVIVVDNSAEEGLEAVVRREIPSANVFKATENEGFGRGNNRGFNSSHGDLVLILNPDAALETNDGLSNVVQRFKRQPDWGMAGLLALNEKGEEEWPVARGYPGDKRSGLDFSHLPGQIAWVVGAAMVVRRPVYQLIGGFDPDFFLYSEETDFCLRVRQAGWAIGHIPDVAVRHTGGASESGRDLGEVTRRKMSGMHRFWAKHYGPEKAVALARRDMVRAAWRLTWHGTRSLFTGKHSTPWRKLRLNLGLFLESRDLIHRKGTPLSFEEARNRHGSKPKTGSAKKHVR